MNDQNEGAEQTFVADGFELRTYRLVARHFRRTKIEQQDEWAWLPVVTCDVQGELTSESDRN